MKDDKTTGIEERLTESELSDLRTIRRASMAIRSCAEILNEHGANAGIPGSPCVFIRLEVDQTNHSHLAPGKPASIHATPFISLGGLTQSDA